MQPQTKKFIDTLDGFRCDEIDELERLKVREAARRLLARVESPYERAWGFCFEHPAVFAALQTCINVGLWQAWTNCAGAGDEEKSIDELAKLTNFGGDTNTLRMF